MAVLLRSALGLLLGVMLLSGCGGSTVGTVTGKVLFKGEPLPSGMVAFQGVGNWVGSSNIREGIYEIKDAPVGDVKITVQTFAPSPSVVPPNTPLSEIKQPSLQFIVIPATYADVATSPLKYTVKPGPQTFDLQVEAK